MVLEHCRRLAARLLVSTLLAGPGGAHAQSISGAGATFPTPLYSRWGEQAKQAIGVELSYDAIGSGGEISRITAGSADFGASDVPLDAAQLDAVKLQQFPTVIGAVVLIVNLPRLRAAQLDYVPLPGPIQDRIRAGWHATHAADAGPPHASP